MLVHLKIMVTDVSTRFGYYYKLIVGRVLTFPYRVLNWTAISCRWALVRALKTLMMAFSSVPKPFIALRRTSASVFGSKG